MSTPREFFVRKIEPRRGTCFVLMPFQDAMTAVYEHGIRPLVESVGMQCRRADEIYSGQSILGDLWGSIQGAEIIIADLTGKNPNVMYELGLCHALWKRVILLSQNKDDVPFDLRAWRVIWYDFTFAGSARLKEELKRAIDALHAEPDLESDLVPLRKSAGQPRTPSFQTPLQEMAWQVGVVEHWKDTGSFGFIKAGTESFYFNPDYMFFEPTPPEPGSRVMFTALDPVEPGKNRRAAKVLPFGSKVRARIQKIIRGKGYGFGEFIGHRGEPMNLFLLLSDESLVSEGDEVECSMDINPQGPVGRDVRRI